MPDNFIRIKQLDKPEVSGFIYSALSGRGLQVISDQLKFSGDFLPATSGDKSLGSLALPFDYVYTTGGVYFNDAVLSVVSGDLRLNDVSVTGDLGVGIVGPSGATGAIGPTGASGRAIISAIGTGVGANGGFTGIYFSLSGANDAALSYTVPISLPTGPSGATGVHITGTLISGSGLYGGDRFLRFLFSNATTGSLITLPTGANGISGSIGPVGGFSYVFLDATGFHTGHSSPPRAYIDQLQASGYSPALNLIRGFTYDFSYAGLNTTNVVIDGEPTDTNLLVSTGDVPGLLRLCFFTSGTTTGRYISGIENQIVSLGQVFINSEYDLDGLRGAVRYDTTSKLKYGFELVEAGDAESLLDQHYVLGTVNFFDTSPAGPQGPTGSTGPQGIAGPTGAQGLQGNPITGVSLASGSGVNSYIFLISGGTQTNPIPLPTGAPGPSGATGATGLTGPIGPKGDTYKTSVYSNSAGLSVRKNSSAEITFPSAMSFTLNDELEFTHDNFKNLAYGVNQKLLFVAENTGTYWNGRVVVYDNLAGLIKVNVESPYGCNSALCSLSAGNPIFSGIFNTNILIDVNLDIVSAVGPSGATGLSGVHVTGASNVGGTGMYFSLSNGNTTNTISIPTGGATGLIGLSGPSGRAIVQASGTGVGTNGGTSGVIFLLSGSGDTSYSQTNVISLPVGPSGATGPYVSTLIQNGNQVNFVLSTTAQITPSITLPAGPTGAQGQAGPYVASSTSVNGSGIFFTLTNGTYTNTIPIPTGGPIGPIGPTGRTIVSASGSGIGVNGGYSNVVFWLSGSGDTSLHSLAPLQFPVGPSGATGIQGPSGVIKFNIKHVNPSDSSYGVMLGSETTNYFDFDIYDSWDCKITGNDVQIEFLPIGFETGLVTTLRITNSGVNPGDVSDNPIVWGTGIHWPNNQSPFFPTTQGRSLFTTFTRFPNKNGYPVYIATYSTSYHI